MCLCYSDSGTAAVLTSKCVGMWGPRDSSWGLIKTIDTSFFPQTTNITHQVVATN